MSVTVGAALKRIAVAILTNPKVLKTVGGIVLGIIIIIIMPIVAVVSIFSGDIEIDTGRLQTMVVENLSAEEQAKLQFVEDTMYGIEEEMEAAGFGGLRVTEAQVLSLIHISLRIYHRLVEAQEQRKIIQNATRRNKLKSGGTDVNETIEAEGNLQDVIELLANLRKNREPLLHVSVFIELKAKSMDALKELQSEIAMELTRSKISVDRLTLRQKEGFLSVLPVGANRFGAQYERCLLYTSRCV